ncbi:MAG: hypothetical protein AAF990_09480 [Bacteroidota bacterium]
MKKKLRQLIVDDICFVYLLQERLKRDPDTEELQWENELQIFEEGYPKHPLIIIFLAKDDYYMGNPLTKEIVEGLNLQLPGLLRRLLNYGLEQGWDGRQQRMKLSNGMAILRSLGFDTKAVEPSAEPRI